MNTPLLSLQGVGLRFRGHSVPILEGVSFSLGAGDRLAVVGRNGVGKSVLMGIAAGLRSPDSGRVEVATDSGPLPPSRCPDAVGYVALDASFPARLSVREAVRCASRLANRWSAEQCETLLGIFDLPGSRRCRVLSQGERAMLGLAIEIARRPSVLVVDEALSVLDSVHSGRLLALLKGERFHALPILFSSHVAGHLDALATSILKLETGLPAVMEAAAGFQP